MGEPAMFSANYIVIAVSDLASTVYHLAIDSFSARSGFGRAWLPGGVRDSDVRDLTAKYVSESTHRVISAIRR